MVFRVAYGNYLGFCTMLILLINLDRRPDRLAFMTTQLRTLGLSFERIEAIDGLSGDFGPDTLGITGIERACALSHRKAWQRFLESGQERCLILEDDMVLSPRLKRFLHAPSNIPPAVDVLRLETRLMRTKLGPKVSRTYDLNIHRMYSTHFGCGAYIVSRAFAEAAVRDLTSFHLPVDHLVFGADEPSFYPAAAYQLRPALGIQAELFEETRTSAVAVSDLQPSRITRFYKIAAAAPPKRSLIVRAIRKAGRTFRKTKDVGGTIYEILIRHRIERNIPFAGPILPVASASLHVHRSEQAVQSAVPTL